MKIAIDCADLDHGRIDGTRVYIKNILEHLGKIDSESQFLLYHQTDLNPLLAPKKYPNYIERKIPYKFWWTQTRFPFELSKDKVDVLWMPIQQLPYLVKGKIRSVVTIHDLAFKIFPDHFISKDRFKLSLFADYAVKKADRIIAVSNSTKNDILKFYPKTAEGKITVIHHGFDSEKFLKKYSKEEIFRTLEKYQIAGENKEAGKMNHESGAMNHKEEANIQTREVDSKFKIQNSKFILYVGAIQPRKGLEILICAFERLKERKQHKCLKLVFVGEPAWKAESTLKQIDHSKNKSDIVLAGKVGFEDLAKIYQGAEVFAFPSFYEGFGIPLLEAMASGTAVVSADNSSLREVGGDAVEYFSTANVEGLESALQKILENSTIREEKVREGFQRAQQFSWEKCADKTLGVLKTVV